MSVEAVGSVGRKPRADAQRNRERLLEVAKAAFAELGPGVSLEEIARRAGVGIGTLYRHFPTREAIIEAVYRRELQQLAEAAIRLRATAAPIEALAQWMRVFIDYVATKKVIAQALSSSPGGGSDLYATASATITDAMAGLVGAAIEAGEVDAGTDAGDLLHALIGFAYGGSGPDWQASALRLIDILMAGLKAQAPAR